jgi:hypothetical protein
MKRHLAVAIISSSLFVSSSGWTRPVLPSDQMARLTKGEVLEFFEDVPNSPIKTAKAIALFPDVPEAVLYVLFDVGKYKNILPRVKDSRVTKYQKGHTFAVIETDLPWPFKDCWAYIELARQNKSNRTFEVKWWMLNGNMKNYTGSALIEPWDKDGKQSTLTYRFFALPNVTAPDSTISDGVKTVAVTIVKRLRLRLAALRKFNKMPAGY